MSRLNRREFLTGAAALSAYASLGRGTDGRLCNVEPHVGCKVGEFTPYDAKVEYLESDGLACIDTGVVAYWDSNVYLEATCDGSLTSRGTFQWWAGASYFNFRAGLAFKATQYGATFCLADNGNSNSSNGKYIGASISNYSLLTTGVMIDGTSSPVNNRSDFWPSRTSKSAIPTFGLFRKHERSSEMVDSWTETVVKSKIRSCRIVDNGVTLFDGFAVRKGNEGCFYDSVSGILLRNAGTGSFTLGPDK